MRGYHPLLLVASYVIVLLPTVLTPKLVFAFLRSTSDLIFILTFLVIVYYFAAVLPHARQINTHHL